MVDLFQFFVLDILEQNCSSSRLHQFFNNYFCDDLFVGFYILTVLIIWFINKKVAFFNLY